MVWEEAQVIRLKLRVEPCMDGQVELEEEVYWALVVLVRVWVDQVPVYEVGKANKSRGKVKRNGGSFIVSDQFVPCYLLMADQVRSTYITNVLDSGMER
jgi:hypothetical protein